MKGVAAFCKCLMPGRPLNPKDLFLILILVMSYCIFETYRTVTTKRINCNGPVAQITRKVIGADTFRTFENDLTLEYIPFGQFGNDTSWKYSDCNKKSCTRIVRNKNNATKNNSRLISTPPSIGFSTISENLLTSTVASYRDKLMTCDEIYKVWLGLKPIQSRTNSGINIRAGSVSTTKNTSDSEVFLQIREAHRGTDGFVKLNEEYKKRMLLGWNIPGLVKFFGACITNQTIRIVQHQPQGVQLCTSLEENGNFSLTECFHLTNFDKAISGQRDKSRAALVFAQSLICFLGKIEENRMFIEDLHGVNFLILTDMSILFTNLESAFFYGSRNLNGKSICIHDYECPTPNGTFWSNGSANQIMYQHCHDYKPTCFRNRCVGFNASIHLCGALRWIQGKVYSYLMRNKDRKMWLYHTRKLTAPFESNRKTGTKICKEMHTMISKYDDERERIENIEGKSGYHFALPPRLANERKIREER